AIEPVSRGLRGDLPIWKDQETKRQCTLARLRYYTASDSATKSQCERINHMNSPALAVVVLAAGQGTRMKSALPKVLHPIAGRPMLAHVLAVAKALSAARMVVVTAPGADKVAKLASEWDAESVVQDRQLGTGHAVLSAEKVLSGFDGNLLVLFGDAPLLTAATLSKLTGRLGPDAE